MGTTELLLLKELGIPLLLELARRRNMDNVTGKAIENILVDPQKALKNLQPDTKKGIVEALADIIDGIFEAIGKIIDD